MGWIMPDAADAQAAFSRPSRGRHSSNSNRAMPASIASTKTSVLTPHDSSDASAGPGQ
jgi:hypothetical protein